MHACRSRSSSERVRWLQMYMSMSHKWKMLAPEHQQAAKWGAMLAPPVLTAAFWSFPSALCYYWTCSNVYTMLMELALRHPGRAPPRMHCCIYQ